MLTVSPQSPGCTVTATTAPVSRSTACSGSGDGCGGGCDGATRRLWRHREHADDSVGSRVHGDGNGGASGASGRRRTGGDGERSRRGTGGGGQGLPQQAGVAGTGRGGRAHGDLGAGTQAAKV